MSATGPLCSTCGIRPARPHFAVGFYKQCTPCHQHRAGKRTRAKHCAGCGTVLRRGTHFCSRSCNRRHYMARMMSVKATVLVALGGMCTCRELHCAHAGPCEITCPDALTVHHIHQDGGQIRNIKRDGTSKRFSGGLGAWTRYRRALRLPDHGMRLLCHNCHHCQAARARRVNAGASGDIMTVASLAKHQRREWRTREERTAHAQRAGRASWQGMTPAARAARVRLARAQSAARRRGTSDQPN